MSIFTDLTPFIKSPKEHKKEITNLAAYIITNQHDYFLTFGISMMVELMYIILDLVLICSFNNSLDDFLWNWGFQAFNLFGMEFYDRSDALTVKFPHYGLVCYST